MPRGRYCKIVAYGCAHWQRRSFHGDTKINPFFEAQFLLDAQKCTPQIVRVLNGGPHPSNHVVPLFDQLAHQFENTVQRRLSRRIGRQFVHSHMELHGRTDQTLQECVVQVFSYSCALDEPFFEAQVEPSGELVKAQAIETEHCQHASQRTWEGEPPSLPDSWLAMDDRCSDYA